MRASNLKDTGVVLENKAMRSINLVVVAAFLAT